MSENKYAGLTALQENVIKTKEHVEAVRAVLDAQKANVFQVTSMPINPTEDMTVLWIAPSTVNYQQGAFYKYTAIAGTDPVKYEWVNITPQVVMDSTLNPSSTNPLENQAIANMLQALQEGVTVIYPSESDRLSVLNFAGGEILAIGSICFCVAEQTFYQVTAINSSSLAITWTAYDPHLATKNDVEGRLAVVDTIPANPRANDSICYIGTTNANFQKGGIYQYLYSQVTPVGDEDPSALGWYEYSISIHKYELSSDTEVDSTKTYYALGWVLISQAQVDLSKYVTTYLGNTAEWSLMSSSEKEEYDIVCLDDDNDNPASLDSYQTKNLSNAIEIMGQSYSTVESALGGLNTAKQDMLTNPLTQSDVVDNLITTTASLPLSAAQGKVLNDKIGDTDISDIGDGTVTGAVSQLNSDLESLATYTIVGGSGANVSEKLTSLATVINSLTEKQRFNSKLQIGSAILSFADITALTYSATIISELGALDVISASVSYSKATAINIATAGTITYTDWTNLDLPVNLRY